MRFLKTWKKNKYKVSLSPHSDYVLRRHFGGTGTKVTEINSTPLVRGSTRQVKITCVTCGGSLWDGVAPGKQTQKVTKTSWVLLFVCLSVVGGAGGNEPTNLFGRGLPLDYTPRPQPDIRAFGRRVLQVLYRRADSTHGSGAAASRPGVCQAAKVYLGSWRPAGQAASPLSSQGRSQVSPATSCPREGMAPGRRWGQRRASCPGRARAAAIAVPPLPAWILSLGLRRGNNQQPRPSVPPRV